MTEGEFIKALDQFEHYIKPEMFAVIKENAEIFSSETKEEIVAKLQEANRQMQELYEYQEKRVNILQEGLNRIDNFYQGLKKKLQAFSENEQVRDKKEAELLLNNL